MQRVWRLLASAKNSGTKNWGHNSAQSFPNLGSSKGQQFRLKKNAEYVKAKLSPKHSPHHQLTTTHETLLQLAPTGSPLWWKSAVLAQSSMAKWLSGLQLDILALASHPKLEYTPLTKFRRKFARSLDPFVPVIQICWNCRHKVRRLFATKGPNSSGVHWTIPRR